MSAAEILLDARQRFADGLRANAFAMFPGARSYPLDVSAAVDSEAEAIELANLTGGDFQCVRDAYGTITGKRCCLVRWKDFEAHKLAYDEPFKAEHDLTDAEFSEDHWQTLFAIQYPEARS